MIKKLEKWYPGEGKLTTGYAILYIILMLGLISAVARLFLGLGAGLDVLPVAEPYRAGIRQAGGRPQLQHRAAARVMRGRPYTPGLRDPDNERWPAFVPRVFPDHRLVPYAGSIHYPKGWC